MIFQIENITIYSVFQENRNTMVYCLLRKKTPDHRLNDPVLSILLCISIFFCRLSCSSGCFSCRGTLPLKSGVLVSQIPPGHGTDCNKACSDKDNAYVAYKIVHFNMNKLAVLLSCLTKCCETCCIIDSNLREHIAVNLHA